MAWYAGCYGSPPIKTRNKSKPDTVRTRYYSIIVEYLKAEHAGEDGIEDSHSSNTIEHEGTSAYYLDQEHLKELFA